MTLQIKLNMLKTKSFLAQINESDGIRISVVGKHEWKPGVMSYTSLTQITPGMYNEWGKVFAPPLKLVGDLYIREICDHDQFRERYLDYLKTIDAEVQALAERGLSERITILCLEESPEFCHRKILAERCKEYQPSLDLIIE